MLEPLAGIVDTAFIGHLGPKSLAALGVGVSVFNSFFWVFNFLVHIPMESVARGAVKGKESSITQARVGLLSSILVGLLSFLFLFSFSESLLRFAGAQPETFNLSREYYFYRVFGQPIVLVYFCLLSILRGIGLSKQSLIPVFLSVGINIFLTFILIFHFDLGVKGAAIGTVTSYLVGLLVTVFLLFKEVGKELFIFRKLPAKDSFFSFSEKSLFLFVRSFCLTGIFFLSTKIAAEIGVYSISAYQIALQFWLFSSFFLDGLAMTGNIETAKLSAAKNSSQFLDFSRQLFSLSFGIGFIFMSVYFLFENQLFSLFTSDELVLENLRLIWPIVLGGQVVNALAFSIDGVYFGLGRHSRLAVMMILNLMFIFLPMAIYGLHQGSLQILLLALLFTSIFRWFYLKKYLYDDFDSQSV